ncbi:MAG: T9SS type A sorting domain-containing protein [Pedobacter sp.]|nr:T9SS type A sorting domain-containing protein [Pedobacter sp.]
MVILGSQNVFAQKADSARVSIKPKPKVVSKIPQIKANYQPYKPSTLGYNAYGPTAPVNTVKTGKILTVLKVYPNPVSDQLNISMRLEREVLLTIKITDMLSNDVVRLANERVPAGEQTKTYTLPNRLNPGMYFLKIEAGGEPKILKIWVL